MAHEVFDFGKEDISFITKHDMRLILVSHFRGIMRYMKLVYFNETHPENQNIMYKPTDQNNLYIIEHGQERAVNNEYILGTLVLDAWKCIAECYFDLEREGKLCEFKSTLVSLETFERIEQFIDAYRQLCNGGTPFLYQDIKQDVYNMIKFLSQELVKKREGVKKKKRNKKTEQPILLQDDQ